MWEWWDAREGGGVNVIVPEGGGVMVEQCGDSRPLVISWSLTRL